MSYNHHPFTYDEDGSLHQISNAKKAPSRSLGLLAVKFNNGVLCIRPAPVIAELELCRTTSQSARNFVTQYDQNAYFIVLGHVVDSLNVKTTIKNIKNAHHNLFNMRLDIETLLASLVTYYKQRFEVKCFPVGVKVLLLDLESKGEKNFF